MGLRMTCMIACVDGSSQLDETVGGKGVKRNFERGKWGTATYHTSLTRHCTELGGKALLDTTTRSAAEKGQWNERTSGAQLKRDKGWSSRSVIVCQCAQVVGRVATK